jgi:hypothetical protein
VFRRFLGRFLAKSSVIPMGFVGCFFVLDFSGRVAEPTTIPLVRCVLSHLISIPADMLMISPSHVSIVIVVCTS